MQAVEEYGKAWKEKLERYGPEQLREQAAAAAGYPANQPQAFRGVHRRS